MKVAKKNRLFVQLFDRARTKGVEQALNTCDEAIDAKAAKRAASMRQNKIS